MNQYKNTTLILPAAGYGTRVSADVRNGKELMEDPILKAPLIEWSLQLGERLGWRVIVISRASKEGLNAYIEKRVNHRVELLKLEEPGEEWPDTILESSDKWSEFNVMVLPDTRFSNPIESLQEVRRGLISDKVKLGTFKVDHKKAGNFAVRMGPSLAEKPVTEFHPVTTAIGLFGFRKRAGQPLFEGFSKRAVWFQPEGLAPFNVNLEWFKDITRNGKVEKYDYELVGS